MISKKGPLIFKFSSLSDCNITRQSIPRGYTSRRIDRYIVASAGYPAIDQLSLQYKLYIQGVAYQRDDDVLSSQTLSKDLQILFKKLLIYDNADYMRVNL